MEEGADEADGKMKREGRQRSIMSLFHCFTYLRRRNTQWTVDTILSPEWRQVLKFEFGGRRGNRHDLHDECGSEITITQW